MKYIIIIMVLMNINLNANYDNSIDNENLNELILLSGIKKQVVSYPEMIAFGIKRGMSRTNIRQNVKMQLINSAKKSIQSREIIDNIKKHLSIALDNKDTIFLLKWYKSDLGKRMVKAEGKLENPEAYQQMMNQAKKLLMNKEKLNLVIEIDELLGLTKYGLDIATKSSISMMTALSIAHNPNKKVNLNEIKNNASKLMNKNKHSIKEGTLLSLLFSYQGFTKQEIGKYIFWLKKPKTTTFHKVTIKAISDSLDESIVKMSKSWMEIYTHNKK